MKYKILVVDDDNVTRHIVRNILDRAGYVTTGAKDGLEALRLLRTRRFHLLVLDVWMPKMNGLQLLERLATRKIRPRAVILTSDDTPTTLLKAIGQRAFSYVKKPAKPIELLGVVRDALKAPEPPPIEVISSRKEWLEFIVPCTRAAAERLQDVMASLDNDLSPDVRASIAHAFRELLLNAIEWGGKLDPTRTVRIAYLRAKRMVLYRIADPGPGFDIERLPHAAIGHGGETPIAHMQIREEQGLRPGGFGLATVQASVDELLYNEKRNEVVFVKYLD